jgi:hypothetical protein
MVEPPEKETAMQYMLLIYQNEKLGADVPEARQQEVFAEWMSYSEDMKKAGVMKAGDPLQPVATATSVRVRGGKRTTTDGPFAETKEQLGGYYLIECKDLDEAIRWAEKCPAARDGTVEVRPVMAFG